MALTITPRKFLRGLGDHGGVVADVTFDSSYPTGGEVLGAAEAAALGFTDIDAVLPQSVAYAQASGFRVVEWVRATNALRLFTALGTEAANASDQSATSVTCVFIGGGISDA